MRRALPVLFCAGAATFAYSVGYEVNAYTVRAADVPVLPPGADPIRLLHISDLHLLPQQHRRQEWIRGLAELRPDLVVNTGDTMASAQSIPAIMHALEPLLDLPGAFIPGNNDYYEPSRKSPIWYFLPKRQIERPPELPWPELARAMGRRGWVDLTNRRASVKVRDAVVAFAGTDDPHLMRDRYDLVAGPADAEAVVRIAAIHAPEPRLIDRFAVDGYDLLLAGHTHGGQVRIPFGPALVTNCGLDRRRARGLHAWDDRLMFNVSAGIGTNPYLPIRFCCRPEASLLTLVARR